MIRDNGVEACYYKCWNARAGAKLLIYGACVDQYKRVWDYVESIKK